MIFRKPALFALFAFCLIATQLSAQNYYYRGAGYNMAFLKSEGLDYVIDRYNQTRTFLDDKMEYCRYYDGPSLRSGLCYNHFFVDFGFTYRSSKVSASGVDATGIRQQRDIKNKWNTFDLGLGIGLGANDNIALAIGVNMGLNSEKTLTRVATPDEIGKANFAKVNGQFKIGFEPFAQLILATDGGFGVLFRPYFSWTPVETDYYEANRYINEFTYTSDPSVIKGKLSGFGLSVVLVAYTESE
jgi:hypothetical protein